MVIFRVCLMLADSFKTMLENELDFRLLSSDRVSAIEIGCDDLSRSATAENDVGVTIILKTLLPSLQDSWVDKIPFLLSISLCTQP